MSKIEQKLLHRRQLGKAQRFIRNNLSKSLKLKQLAKASGTSPYHFIRIFAAYTRETPFSFIRRQKIVCAMEMILNKDLKDIN